MASRYGKFLALDSRSKLMLCRVWVLLGYYRLALSLRGFRRLSSGLRLCREEPPRRHCSPAALVQAARLGRLVAVAARYTPWCSSCLVQVLALQSLLARRKIDGRFYLGVCRHPGRDEPLAHAWLRCGDSIVIGAGAHSHYSVLATYCWGEGELEPAAASMPGEVTPEAWPA